MLRAIAAVACYSAGGADADRPRNLLKFLRLKGSKFGAYLHSELVPHRGHVLALPMWRMVISVAAPSQTALSTTKPSGTSAPVEGRAA
jgi:hypothetical protein